ncbi:MAG: rhodanese-like domain-containing protein [Paracoccaceae bacterium]
MKNATNMTSRRSLMMSAGAFFITNGAVAQSVPTAGGDLTPPDAHALAQSKQITLVDIRRPDEWAKTGSGQGANRLDMRRKDFVPELVKLVKGDTTAPVALICARGHRSARMTRALKKAGFTNIIDVPEGMLGSRAGPGWIKRKLPLNRG